MAKGIEALMILGDGGEGSKRQGLGFGVFLEVTQDLASPGGFRDWVRDSFRWVVTRWVPPYKAHIRLV